MIAFVVVAAIMSVAFTSDSGQLGHVAVSFAETKAGRIASGRLAELRAAERAPALGSAAFAIPANVGVGLTAVSGVQRVRQLEPGLFEAVVEVRWTSRGAQRPRQVVLTTLMEWEEAR